MDIKDALEVFGNLNAFRENPTSLPPHFPESRQLNEACGVVRNFLANAIVLTTKDIENLHNIMYETAGVNITYQLSPQEYAEILKRFNETRK